MKKRSNRSPVSAYSYETAVAVGVVPEQPQPFWRRLWNRFRLRYLPLPPPRKQVARNLTDLDLIVLQSDETEYMDLDQPKPDREMRARTARMIESLRAESKRNGVGNATLDNLAVMLQQSEASWRRGPSEPNHSLHWQLRHVLDAARRYDPETHKKLWWSIWNRNRQEWIKGENGETLKSQDLYYVLHLHTRLLNEGAKGLELRQYIDEHNDVPELRERAESAPSSHEADEGR